jgi:Cu(I)/Ag(I) efflux system membrane fusion protein
VDQAQRLVDASRTRLRLLGLSDPMIDEMAEWQGPDKALLLSDPGRLVWVYASVYEYELSSVQVGGVVAVETASAPGRRWEGTIRAVDSVLDPATRSARVRVQLEDPESLLRPEMYVDASITVALGEVLAVPEEAVFQTGTRAIVFVDQGQGLFEPRDVTVGAKADQFYEMRSGVTEGERVVTSGNFLIDSESRLKGALQGMGGGHQHGQ